MIDSIITLVGFVTVALCLIAATGLLAIISKLLLDKVATNTMQIIRLSTARYWVQRMEKEGLTICTKEYQRMCKEQKPKTAQDFIKIEQDFNNKLG